SGPTHPLGSLAATWRRLFRAAASTFSTTDRFNFAGANISMLAPFLLMTLTRQSPCKVNFLLNILAKRADGFHELETVIQPVPVFDELQFNLGGRSIELTCNHSALAVDSTNLVHRAAAAFLQAARRAE